MVIWLLCMHCHSRSFARAWTEKRLCKFKDWWLDFVTMITWSWVEPSLGQVVGQSIVQPEQGVSIGGWSSHCSVWKCWQCFDTDRVSIWLQLWCKGTRSTAKVRRQRASVEMVHDLQANTKENCVLFVWWMNLVLHMAPPVSLLGPWLCIRLRLVFWGESEGHPPEVC